MKIVEGESVEPGVIESSGSFSAEEIEALVAEAEAGVDFPEQLDPALNLLLLLPADTRALVVKESKATGRDVEDIIVEAITSRLTA